MAKPLAVLVEDGVDARAAATEVLMNAQFEVLTFEALAPVLNFMENSSDLVDLFVLDRMLPMNPGSSPSVELGDQLLREVRDNFVDSRVIVFTGFTRIDHVQMALAGGGQIPSRDGSPHDKITVLQKHQGLDFKKQIRRFRDLLQSLDDIELTPLDPDERLSELDKRMLRRLAWEYSAVSISVKRLTGGLTSSSVWRCELFTTNGHVSTIVAKTAESPNRPLTGGLPELVSHGIATATLSTLTGLMGGKVINTLQLAGNDAYPVMDLIGRNPEMAYQLVEPVLKQLGEIKSGRKILTVGDLVAPLIDWETLDTRLREHNIPVPSDSMSVTVEVGVRHGDLHPGNILVDNSQAKLIDLDGNDFAAGALDPVTLLLSTLVHPDSPIKGRHWPDEQHIADTFGTRDFGKGHDAEAWFKGINTWLHDCCQGDRELWATVLSYTARQLGYQDVLDDPEILNRVLSIAKMASQELMYS